MQLDLDESNTQALYRYSRDRELGRTIGAKQVSFREKASGLVQRLDVHDDPENSIFFGVNDPDRRARAD